MHNCSETKERMTELLLDGVDEVGTLELSQCTACSAEFDVLSATLRLTTRLGQNAAPSEGYWAGYHRTLRLRLANARLGATIAPKESRAQAQRRKEKLGPLFVSLRPGARTAFARFLKSSVRVPVPLGLALIIICMGLGLFAVEAARRPTAPNQIVVHVPVEVPVVQEKFVTQVVYRDRRLPSRSSKRITADSRAESALARSQKPRTDDIPSLTGFKPTEEVKLTVIKGGSPNEK
jgi:hypothetical protein